MNIEDNFYPTFFQAQACLDKALDPKRVTSRWTDNLGNLIIAYGMQGFESSYILPSDGRVLMRGMSIPLPSAEQPSSRLGLSFYPASQYTTEVTKIALDLLLKGQNVQNTSLTIFGDLNRQSRAITYAVRDETTLPRLNETNYNPYSRPVIIVNGKEIDDPNSRKEYFSAVKGLIHSILISN